MARKELAFAFGLLKVCALLISLCFALLFGPGIQPTLSLSLSRGGLETGLGDINAFAPVTSTATVTPTVSATASKTKATPATATPSATKPRATPSTTAPLKQGPPATATATKSSTRTPTVLSSTSVTPSRTPTLRPTATLTPSRTPTSRAVRRPGDLWQVFLPLVESNTVPPSNNEMGLERFWTFQQFRLTDRLTLFVNLWNGNLVAQYNEFVIPSRGLPLSLNHTFNSGVNLTSTMGYNWTHDLNYRLVNSGTAEFTLHDGDGTQLVFNNPSGGVYTSPPGNFDTLVQAGNTLTLTHKDQSKHVFALNAGSTWYPTAIQDRFGNAISLSYDGSNNLTSATAAGGQTLTFTPSGGALASVADNASHSFGYQYNPTTGDLTSITDPLAFTTGFTFTNHLLTSITDPRNTQTLITYDTNNRVQTITIAGKLVATLNYTSFFGASPRRLRPASSYNTFTDGNGNVTTYSFSDTGQVAQRQDALNGITSYAFDANYDVIQTTDALNRTTYAVYDMLGNLTIYTDTLDQKTAYAYNGTNDLLSVTDPLNRLTRYGYDGVGNLTVITDALGFTTNYAYNSYGQRTSATDANNHTTRYGYNSAGFVITTTDALNNLTQYGYDVIGNRTAITDARNNVTTIAYDANNRLLSSTMPLTGTQSAVVSYGYDSVGNRTTITDAMSSVSRYAYDALNRVISTTMPITGSQIALTQYGYDVVGNRTVITDANTNVTRYGYDALNRTSVITDASGNATKYDYDAISNRTVITDTVSNVTRYDYDNLNRVITITNPLGKKQKFSYDAVGNTLFYTDEVTQTTRYAYDSLNRVISTTNALTQTTRYGYDKVGNTIAITSPTGITTTLTYWDNNWLKTKRTSIGTTQYAHDPVGNLQTLTDPSGATQNFVYDKANRLAQEQDRDAGSNLVVTYVNEYDANSNRTRESEKRTGKPDRDSYYYYNKANWLVSTTDAGGGVTLYTYDAVGNRTGVSDALGVTTIITPTVTNLPASASHYQSGAWQDTITNTYDTRNNLSGLTTNFTSTYGNFTFGSLSPYNSNNYMSIFTNTVGGIPHDSYSLTYTDNNLANTINGSGIVYDSLNRVACYKASNVVAAVFWGYNPDGNRRFFRSGYLWYQGCDTFDPGPVNGGRREDYSYTGQKLTQRVWGLWDPADSTTNYMTSTMSYDPAGNLTQEVITNTNPATTTTKSYNWMWQAGAYRMTTFTATNGVTTTFDYDSAGRISRRYTFYGYSDYSYVDGTDWLLRETWHSYVSGNSFNLHEYWYTNGRPSRVKYVGNAPPDLSFVWSYNTQYIQYNWHGDFAVGINLDGVGGGPTGYGPWGLIGDGQYYQWSGGWGYMTFSSLQMYYVHGRWYNPDIGRFISPDEKGEYLYGSGNDPINWAWIAEQGIALGKSGSVGRAIVLGGGGFVRDTAWANYQIFYPPAEWTYWDRLGNTTRGVAPIFLAEGVVTLGPQAVSAGATYLGKTLLGRVATTAAAGCAADQRDCANVIQQGNLIISRISMPDPKLTYLFTGKNADGFLKLGFSPTNANQLRQTIISIGQKVDLATPSELTEYGSKFQQAAEIIGPNGVIGRITTIWQIDNGTDILRFVTAWSEVFK